MKQFWIEQYLNDPTAPFPWEFVAVASLVATWAYWVTVSILWPKRRVK
jgi:hypothetical protein